MNIKSILFFRLSSVMQAIGYGVLTYFVIYRLLAGEDVLLTYLLNLLFIIVVMWLDTIAHRFAERKAPVIREMYAGMGPAIKAVYLLSQGFIRTGMYLFYITALVLSRVEILRPDFLPVALGSFFASIEYGIVLLFAFDQMYKRLKTDKEWIEKNVLP